MFNYKNESLNLDDGFSISEVEQLNGNDYKALDFAFSGDEIFNSSFYLEENPDVADDGINPFTQYFFSGADEGRDPSTYFDTSYYFDKNPDVANDENNINPLFHYFNTGASENRDPDPAFDTSFYLEDNPDVAESGINPLLQYLQSGASEGRFANENFKAFEESGQAWVVDRDISNEEFNNLKNSVKSVSQEAGGAGGSLLFWVRIYFEGVKYALKFEIIEDTLELSDSLQQFIEKSNEETQVYVLPENEQLTDGENVTTFDPPNVDFGTPPFDLGEPIGFDDNTFFPKGDGFLDDLLEGKFEVSDDGERGSYFLAVSDVYDDSQGFTMSNKPDTEADRLAERLGGKSKQIFNSDENQKEFDVISDQYIAETKEGNPQLNKKIRVQAKRTFEAAQQTGREVYYEFENPPADDLIAKLNEYSERYGVNLTIDVLNP